jgi:RNA polymerase sigma-70 factor (ECF subfamily)
MKGSSGTLAINGFMTSQQRTGHKEQRVQDLDGFLQSVQRKALCMARLGSGNSEEAFDIVQDVMLAFVRRYRSKPAEQWPPLFYRALNNRITDYHRRRAVRGRWQAFLGRGEADEQSDPIQLAADPSGYNPERAGADGQFGQALESALQTLPHRQRQAFLFRTWQGLSVAETARIMGCSAGSVKTHLSRATRALRSQLGEHR